MSYSIDGNSITLTRGDTLRVKVDMYWKNDDGSRGEPYTPQVGDSVRFALKHNVLNEDRTEYTDPDPLVLREIPIDTMILELVPEDTKHLGFGRYVYDVQITFEDGTVHTFITKAPFKLTEEVE